MCYLENLRGRVENYAMNWFGPRLEPGERVVWRLPAPLTRRQWIIRLAITTVIVAAILAIALWLGSPNAAFYAMVMVLAALMRFRLPNYISGWERTVYAITDRRLLEKRSISWWSPIEIRLDDIESIYLNAATYFFVVRGGGQEIEFAPELIERNELERIIKQAKAGEL